MPDRSSGVLLHVTSLPSRYGIGDLGPAAYAWIDRLASAKQSWWQILPLNQPDGSDSPYSAQSAFAGNVNLISPELLVRDGLLRADDHLGEPLPVRRHIAFEQVNNVRQQFLLRVAYQRFRRGTGGKRLRKAYDAFVEREKHWLDDYAIFVAIKRAHLNRPWSEWPAEHVSLRAQEREQVRYSLREFIDQELLSQFLFRHQLDALRAHAKRRGVRLIGDVPIYLGYDSADVWANPHLFQLDKRRRPIAVAGVPPDMFSETGQRWGNPLYDWKAMAREGYRWWIDRIAAALTQADLIRIDHFRGLAGYWRIPARAKTAQRGKWVKGPGAALLEAIRKRLGDLPLIAEDLGVITPDVERLREDFALPGMKVLQFAFGEDDSSMLPHAHPRNAIVYTGNHDTDTTAGWWRTLDAASRKRLQRYAPEAKRDPLAAMLRLAMASPADIAIVPAQDLFALGSPHRMNTPGTDANAWTWRLPEACLHDEAAWERLGEMTTTYARARS